MSLLERRNAQKKEVHILQHAYCYPYCKHCFLDRNVIGFDSKSLYAHMSEYFSIEDLNDVGSIVIMGGDLFNERAISSVETTKLLTELLDRVYKLVTHYPYIRLNLPVVLNTLGKNSIEYLNRLVLKYPRYELSANWPSDRGEKFTSNYLKMYHLLKRLGITGFKNVKLPKRTTQQFDFEELIMIDEKFAYDYSESCSCVNSKLLKLFPGVHCCNNKLDIITSTGVHTCGQVTRKPEWVLQGEWDRFCNDREYIKEGYQQVIDWYGCEDCKHSNNCPGMCWITYYAQKNLFNNRKCLYKGRFKEEK